MSRGIFSIMSEREDGSLYFGTRSIQKIRHSYAIVIPKALANALKLGSGDSIGFVLRWDGQIVLQKDEKQ
jgi:antitoxin component of MazEF toxin-antitoxin module